MFKMLHFLADSAAIGILVLLKFVGLATNKINNFNEQRPQFQRQITLNSLLPYIIS